MTDTSLLFRPAMPKRTSQITVAFTPAIHVYEGYEVRVALAGWTSGAADGVPGPDRKRIVVRDDYLAVGNIDEGDEGEKGDEAIMAMMAMIRSCP